MEKITALKLDVIEFYHTLFTSPSNIGYYDKNNYLKRKFDWKEYRYSYLHKDYDKDFIENKLIELGEILKIKR